MPGSFFFKIHVIIGTIPPLTNSAAPANQPAKGSLPVQPIMPQLLTNNQGQIIATVIGNQILPVINTQGITLSPMKPGQQVHLRRAHTAACRLVVSTYCRTPLPPADPQTAPGEVDGVSLEEIREFARAFKIRRLSLGLTQTQVGQALSAAEGPAYSQSAICRFEKLDITPKSAQKIKPVLERWMAEAEARHRSGVQNLTDFIGSEPSKKRKRRTSFTPQALEILNTHFEKNTHPSGQEMTEIAEKLNYDREVVRVWFYPNNTPTFLCLYVFEIFTFLVIEQINV
uniref:POU domain protein n=1 Tax=Scleropages formosus TaxID=113540 RepID=A0A8C9T1F1_SCLFO